MPRQGKDLKRLVRARAAETGERYTVARSRLVQDEHAAQPQVLVMPVALTGGADAGIGRSGLVAAVRAAGWAVTVAPHVRYRSATEAVSMIDELKPDATLVVLWNEGSELVGEELVVAVGSTVPLATVAPTDFGMAGRAPLAAIVPAAVLPPARECSVAAFTMADVVLIAQWLSAAAGLDPEQRRLLALQMRLRQAAEAVLAVLSVSNMSIGAAAEATYASSPRGEPAGDAVPRILAGTLAATSASRVEVEHDAARGWTVTIDAAQRGGLVGRRGGTAETLRALLAHAAKGIDLRVNVIREGQPGVTRKGSVG